MDLVLNVNKMIKMTSFSPQSQQYPSQKAKKNAQILKCRSVTSGMLLEVADVDTKHGEKINKLAMNLVEPPGIGLIDLDSVKVLSLNANVYHLIFSLRLNHPKYPTNVAMLNLSQEKSAKEKVPYSSQN